VKSADLQRLLDAPTGDYNGLRAGDRVTVWYGPHQIKSVIVDTCEFGALAEYPWGGRTYVRRCVDGVWSQWNGAAS